MIHARGLGRTFGDRVAVDNVWFDVGAGEVFGLLGPNGAGKTTTLRMLAGLIAPTSGHALVAGLALERGSIDQVRARVGFLTEAPGHWDRLSVRMNLLVYARLYGVARPEETVDRSLRAFELADRAGDTAASLSKGLKQKLAIARALIHDPPVVLLDEPTSGLDPSTARLVRDLILSLKTRGRAVIVSTHNLDEAERLSDRIGVLNQRFLAVGTPASLRHELFGRRVRVELAGDAAPFAASAAGLAQDIEVDGPTLRCGVTDLTRDVPVLVRALVESGASILQVRAEEAPLEEVYLTLVSQAEAAGAPDGEEP